MRRNVTQGGGICRAPSFAQRRSRRRATQLHCKCTAVVLQWGLVRCALHPRHSTSEAGAYGAASSLLHSPWTRVPPNGHPCGEWDRPTWPLEWRVWGNRKQAQFACAAVPYRSVHSTQTNSPYLPHVRPRTALVILWSCTPRLEPASTSATGRYTKVARPQGCFETYTCLYSK